MNEVTTIILVVIGVVIVGMFGGYLFNKLIDDIFQLYSLHKAKASFEQDFIESVMYSQPTYNQIKEIAGTRELPQEISVLIYRRYIREIRKGKNPDLEPHLELIEGYVREFNREQPFQDLPSDIRLYLERVRDKLDDKTTLEALTSHIRELVALNNRENKKLKFYTVGGFFVGILGVSLAIIFYFAPPSNNAENLAQEKTVISELIEK
ncbi:hypothetical protein EXA23_17265 [Vibrio cincinnatiensis]|uniref:hypothetical protein n=1 Tax=Vibrio cincinnatiensis TaxID=675 RepID=UPI001EDD7FF8|nr:hypothetical protein [Vibrio cincinnatiensis]MCG3767872.1 hypothetical protein [Vibrio cincinnatiensis]